MLSMSAVGTERTAQECDVRCERGADVAASKIVRL